MENITVENPILDEIVLSYVYNNTTKGYNSCIIIPIEVTLSNELYFNVDTYIKNNRNINNEINYTILLEPKNYILSNI